MTCTRCERDSREYFVDSNFQYRTEPISLLGKTLQRTPSRRLYKVYLSLSLLLTFLESPCCQATDSPFQITPRYFIHSLVIWNALHRHEHVMGKWVTWTICIHKRIPSPTYTLVNMRTWPHLATTQETSDTKSVKCECSETHSSA